MGKLKFRKTRNRNRSKNKLYGGRSRKRKINKRFSKRVKNNYLSKKRKRSRRFKKSRNMYGGVQNPKYRNSNNKTKTRYNKRRTRRSSQSKQRGGWVYALAEDGGRDQNGVPISFMIDSKGKMTNDINQCCCLITGEHNITAHELLGKELHIWDERPRNFPIYAAPTRAHMDVMTPIADIEWDDDDEEEQEKHEPDSDKRANTHRKVDNARAIAGPGTGIIPGYGPLTYKSLHTPPIVAVHKITARRKGKKARGIEYDEGTESQASMHIPKKADVYYAIFIENADDLSSIESTLVKSIKLYKGYDVVQTAERLPRSHVPLPPADAKYADAASASAATSGTKSPARKSSALLALEQEEVKQARRQEEEAVAQAATNQRMSEGTKSPSGNMNYEDCVAKEYIKALDKGFDDEGAIVEARAMCDSLAHKRHPQPMRPPHASPGRPPAEALISRAPDLTKDAVTLFYNRLPQVNKTDKEITDLVSDYNRRTGSGVWEPFYPEVLRQLLNQKYNSFPYHYATLITKHQKNVMGESHNRRWCELHGNVLEMYNTETSRRTMKIQLTRKGTSIKKDPKDTRLVITQFGYTYTLEFCDEKTRDKWYYYVHWGKHHDFGNVTAANNYEPLTADSGLTIIQMRSTNIGKYKIGDAFNKNGIEGQIVDTQPDNQNDKFGAGTIFVDTKIPPQDQLAIMP